MFKKTALVAGIGLALSVTAQADYQWELDAGYARGTFDYDFRNIPGLGNEGDSVDADIFNIGGTYFLETVDTSKGPLGEAAFLDRASSLGLAFTDGTVQLDGRDDEDAQTYNADMRYIAEGPGWKLSGAIVDLGYQREEAGDAQVDSYDLGLGYYIFQNTTAVVNYQRIDVNDGPDADAWSLDLEQFWAFGNGGLKARASGGKTYLSDSQDDPTTWLLGGTWYLNNNIGFGADYLQSDDDGFETQGFRVNAEWFITENFAVDLAYTDISPDDIDSPLSVLNPPIFGGKLEQSYDEIGK